MQVGNGYSKNGASMNSDIPIHARPGLTAGPVTAPPGTKASGEIAVPAAHDEATTIPVTIVNGAKNGPVLALVAGNHGYEYAPILALQRLRAQIDPGRLAGTILMVHVANMPSFLG